MDKDFARQIDQLREEIADQETDRDPARIRVQQTLAGALYAIAMAARGDYEALARARSRRDARRETALVNATLKAVDQDERPPAGKWAGDFFFGSALLRTAAASRAALRHHFVALMGEGFCRSPLRLEEQASRDGLITEADRRLLAAIREDAAAFGQDPGPADGRAATSLNDLVVALRVLAGVVRGGATAPRADRARA
jgi:hypothetical protein